MKQKSEFIFCTDLHIRSTIPSCRREEPKEWIDYQIDKLEEIFKYAKEYNITEIFCGGDFFDRYRYDDSNYLLCSLIKLFNNYSNINFFFIYGNHDLPYHSEDNVEDSLIAVLESSCNNFHNPFTNENQFDCSNEDNCYNVYGFNYGNKIDKGRRNIAIVHTNIFEREVPPYMEGITAKEFLENHNYKLVLSGHLHENYVYKDDKGNVLINGGCLTRQRTDKIDFKPCFWHINYDDGNTNVEQINISVKENEIITKLKEDNKIEIFVDKINNVSNAETLDFKDEISKEMLLTNVTDNVKVIIEECLEE